VRQFDFPGPTSHTNATFELHVVATDDDTTVPVVQVTSAEGVLLGELKPELVIPAAPPGSVRALAVPRLAIKTGVINTYWEPPAFVAGQISTTAALGEGNSVLIGHRRGQAGDVFSRLIGATLGDEVVATSRAGEYRYFVSQVLTLPGDDITPMKPMTTPRLTLMTCTGAWNPLTGEYSHRLWVIAEPPDAALATLEATIARAANAITTATAPSDVTRFRSEATRARAAHQLVSAIRRR
jgi:hypothetical protein